MAKRLNRSRILFSKISFVMMFVIILFSREYWRDEALLHELLDLAGYILIAVCVLGRVYTTAFLGGFKNKTLITHGPFSLVRNPLYFFSLVGVFGISLMSNHLSVIVAIPVIFTVMYHSLIKREEAFLLEEFGDSYRQFMLSTPRLFPSFKNYHAPETVQMAPRFLNNAIFDAVWWFLPYPVFELIEYLQDGHILPVLF